MAYKRIYLSQESITIKPTNHRIYQCRADKKIALLNKLIVESKYEDIIVVCSREPEALREALQNRDVQVVEDRDFVCDDKVQCSYLISYDMPIEAIVYVARVAKATQRAVMLLDEEEQKSLYKIEMLLGRAIKQEKIEGFEYPQKELKERSTPVRKKLSKEEIKEVAKKRYEKSTREDEKPVFDKDEKRDYKRKDPKKFAPKKSMPMPKTTGKKITIKTLKPKDF
jgi:superfamily II DNA/RNA helicase